MKMLVQYQQSRQQKYVKDMKAYSHRNIQLKLKAFKIFVMVKNTKTNWREVEMQICAKRLFQLKYKVFQELRNNIITKSIKK